MFNKYLEYFKSQDLRIQVVIIGNLIFSAYYFYLFFGSFYKFDELPILNTIRNGAACIGMGLGSYFLLHRKHLGKTVTRLVGALGLVYIIGYALYGTTFIGKPGYSTIVIINYTIEYISNIFTGFAYPLIAGYIILGKPNNELNLY